MGRVGHKIYYVNSLACNHFFFRLRQDTILLFFVPTHLRIEKQILILINAFFTFVKIVSRFSILHIFEVRVRAKKKKN